MAEKDNIVDRMKTEGQLTRNSGTNSIKSVRVDLHRLEGIFESMERGIALQASFIESLYNIQVDKFSMDRERNRDLDRLERLRGINDEPPPGESGETNNDESPSNDTEDDKKTESIISRIFSGRAGLIAVAAIASPFIYQFAKGFIDGVTGGKFSEAENWIVEQWPVIVDQASAGFEWARSQFNWIKDTIQLAYNNINSFLTTGNIEDLFKDENGNTTMDLQALERNAVKWISSATSLLLFGPLGAIKTAMANSLINTVEDLTGFELSPGAQLALTTLIGAPGTGMVAGRVAMGLIKVAMRAVALNPVLAIAAAGAAAVYWMGNRLKNTIDDYNATQIEADRILQDTEDRLAIEGAARQIEADTGATVGQTTNEGLTSVTNSDQLARVVAGILAPQGLQFNQLTEDEQQQVLDQATVQLTPWINDTFERLVSNQGFYGNLVNSLVDNEGDSDLAMRQLQFFMDRAKAEAEGGNINAATAYNNVLLSMQRQLEGASLDEVREFTAEGFADYLRQLGFQEGFEGSQVPMIDFEDMQNRLENSSPIPGDGVSDASGGGIAISTGGNVVKQGDRVSNSSVTIITPKESSSSLNNNSSGVMQAF